MWKKRHVCERDYIWTPSICSCENEKILASIANDSVIICDGVIDSYEKETKPQQILMKRKQPAKRKISIFYLHVYYLL